MKYMIYTTVILFIELAVICYWGSKIVDTVNNVSDSIGYTECKLVGVLKEEQNES